MKSKKDTLAMLDPNRFKIAKNMAIIPGGPMNNNPMNVTSIDPQTSSFSGINKYPYEDSGMQNPHQLGGVYPMMNTMKPQNQVSGIGKNTVYGSVPGPTGNMADAMEGVRLGENAAKLKLNASPMGAIGESATVAPGGSIPQVQQTPFTMGLQGQQSAEIQPKGMNTKTGKRS